jgi:hypothetical protein
MLSLSIQVLTEKPCPPLGVMFDRPKPDLWRARKRDKQGFHELVKNSTIRRAPDKVKMAAAREVTLMKWKDAKR